MRSRLPDLLLEKQRAEGRRITQRELAEKTGLSVMTISSWMSPLPIEQVSSRTVVRLCDYFNCTIGDLLVIESTK